MVFVPAGVFVLSIGWFGVVDGVVPLVPPFGVVPVSVVPAGALGAVDIAPFDVVLIAPLDDGALPGLVACCSLSCAVVCSSAEFSADDAAALCLR